MTSSPLSALSSSPILRWLVATQLLPDDDSIDRAALQADLIQCPEVRRWLNLLGSGPVHHSKDSAAENALAKLCEYGLRAGISELDVKALPYCAVAEGEPYAAEALILVPFLVRAGYADEPRVARWMERRIQVLYELAHARDYDLYMNETERKVLPPSQQTLHGAPKLFYRPHFSDHWAYLGLPTCYDLYALAYYPKEDPATRHKIETIVEYLLDPAFQDTPGGYIWNAQRRQAYAAGRVFLACLPRLEGLIDGSRSDEKNVYQVRQESPQYEQHKLVLFLEMLARFECARISAWFRNGLAHLETFRTPADTYRFPRAYLAESSGYYLYAGLHMGLGESPRDARALERESTFRMTRIRSQI
jgi:hypothetical protein